MINYIDKDIVIISILILVGILLRLRYLIDYNKGKIKNFNTSLITLVLYTLLIFTYQIVGMTISNDQTLNYINIMYFITLLPLVCVIIINFIILIKNWSNVEYKTIEIIGSILLICIFPIGAIISVLAPIASIIIIPLKYLDNIKKNRHSNMNSNNHK